MLFWTITRVNATYWAIRLENMGLCHFMQKAELGFFYKSYPNKVQNRAYAR